MSFSSGHSSKYLHHEYLYHCSLKAESTELCNHRKEEEEKPMEGNLPLLSWVQHHYEYCLEIEVANLCSHQHSFYPYGSLLLRSW